MINEETIIKNQNAGNENQSNAPAVIENEKEASWKKVTIGGVAGILMGAGAMYATDALAGENSEVAAETEAGAGAGSGSAAASGASHDVTHRVADNGLKVADVSDEMSFGEAFAAAREEVGAGGVFEWKGKLYNTYIEEEWDAMSASDKAEFAELVKPELAGAEQQNTAATAETNDAAAEKPADASEAKETAEETPAEGSTAKATEAQAVSDDADVNIVGSGEVDGHEAVVVDVNDDQQGDVAVIDVDDSGSLTSPDVVVDSLGNKTTVGEMTESKSAETTPASDDADVNIVGSGEVDGHAAVVIDVDKDQQGDVAVIDVDDSGSLTSPDVVVDSQGNQATMGEIAETAAATDPYCATQQCGMENPDIAPDASADMMMYDV